MQDVRIDSEGKLRCWNCGTCEQFVQQRTTRSKVLVGVGALLTKKKLKCVVCGKYNQTGNAKPYLGGAPQAHAAGWFADPWQQAALRWFDGAQWTGHTRENGPAPSPPTRPSPPPLPPEPPMPPERPMPPMPPGYR